MYTCEVVGAHRRQSCIAVSMCNLIIIVLCRRFSSATMPDMHRPRLVPARIPPWRQQPPALSVPMPHKVPPKMGRAVPKKRPRGVPGPSATSSFARTTSCPAKRPRPKSFAAMPGANDQSNDGGPVTYATWKDPNFPPPPPPSGVGDRGTSGQPWQGWQGWRGSQCWQGWRGSSRWQGRCDQACWGQQVHGSDSDEDAFSVASSPSFACPAGADDAASESCDDVDGEECSLYDVLGVRQDATAAEVRAAWRLAVLRSHPDKPGGSADEFRRVREAWNILGDSRSRAVYDRVA